MIFFMQNLKNEIFPLNPLILYYSSFSSYFIKTFWFDPCSVTCYRKHDSANVVLDIPMKAS